MTKIMVGTADGLKAKNFIGKDNFILLLGDNFFEMNFLL